MLVARGRRTIGAATVRWAVAFGRRVWFKLVESNGVVLDTRFVPAAPGPAKPRVCVYLLVRGTWETSSATGGAPDFGPRTAIAIRFDQLEGADGVRPFTVRLAGEPFLAIEMHFAEADLRDLPPMPGALELDVRAWDAATRAATLSQNDDEAVSQGLRDVLERMVDVGFVADSAAVKVLAPPPRPLLRLWRAVQPMVERMSLAATIGDVGGEAGLSPRQTERELGRWLGGFGLVGPGIRGMTRHVRLKMAVLFLSAADSTVTDIATAVGYGSVDAMARAFRDAGLPPPMTVKRALARHERRLAMNA